MLDKKTLPLVYKIVLVTLLIQTIVVSNIIKGLIFPYVFILLLFMLDILVINKNRLNYILPRVTIFVAFFIILVNISQLSNALFISSLNPDYSLWVDIHDLDTSTFKKSLITQSLYFITSIIFFFYTLFFLRQGEFKDIFKFIKIGLYFFIFYGYFLYFGYLITGESLDFLSNRITGTNNTFGGELQHVVFGGISLPRFQSLVGEPSMFAFSIVPFFIYYYYFKEKFIYINLLIALLLSTSGTAIVGLISFFLIDMILYRKTLNLIILLLLVSIFIAILKYDVLLDFYLFFINKINLEHVSGIVRFENFFDTMNYFMSLSTLNNLFGIGFGYVRSTDGFSTILLNTGVVGFVIILLIYLYPILLLKANNLFIKALKVINLVILIMMLTSVPEFYNLQIYFFLALLWFEYLKRNTIANN